MKSEKRILSRRDAIKLVMAASATIPAVSLSSFGAERVATAQPYGTDPVLTRIYHPGDLWPLTFDDAQTETVRALADLILPAGDGSPAASEVGVVEFVDEWISAPYEAQREDREIILSGLTWINLESQKRFSKNFSELSLTHQTAIADDIAYADRAKANLKAGAEFFARFRSVSAGGYYATRAGWKDIGYIGNVPTVEFKLPPKEVLDRLGVQA